jgi:hypothetical protein
MTIGGKRSLTRREGDNSYDTAVPIEFVGLSHNDDLPGWGNHYQVRGFPR